MQQASRTSNNLFSVNFFVRQISKHLSTRSNRKRQRKNALSRAVVVASASVLVPFASETAFANSFADSYETSPHLVSQTTQLDPIALAQIPLGRVSNQARVSSPLVEPLTQVAFSSGHALAPASQQPSAAVSEDHSWSLSYATQANTTQVNSAVQSVIAKVASDTAQAKACLEESCRRLTYIRSQLPIAAARVQRLEEQLKDFSRQHGQGDIDAYKKALADRILEVSSQKRQLDIELDQTRLRAEQLKTHLSFADMEVDSADQILAEDTVYQVMWGQLSTVEDNIQKEYSRVNTDGTALNQLYDEYQALLGKTHVAAREAFNRHLLAGGSQVSGITYYPETTAESFGALLVETHQHRVQQLRQRKLVALETALIGRQQRLSRNMDEYGRLQSELLSQQSVLNSYQSERDRILAASPEAALAVSGIPTHNTQSVVAAQTLLPLLPNGSIAKTLLGIALAASMVAAASHRRAEKQAALLGKRILEIFPTNHTANRPANSHAAKGQSSHAAKGQSAEGTKSQPQIISLSDLASEPQVEKSASKNLETADAKGIEIVESAGSVEVMFATEEMPKQPDSFCVVNDLGEFEISESAMQPLSKIAPEIELDDFNQALENLTPENLLTEADSQDITPVRLPVADTDLFLDQVLDWISEDLGLAAPIAVSGESDKAEAVKNSVVDSVVVDSVVVDSVVADSVAVDLTTPNATADSTAPSTVV